jgi:hypothetical protein
LGTAKVQDVPTVTGQPAKSADEKNEPLAELGVAPGAPAKADEPAPKK